MRSENTGKKVKDIKYEKKNVVIIFDDDSTLTTYEDVMLDYLIYIDKELDKKTIKEIEQASSSNNCLKKAISLLSKYTYTSNELYNKLKGKYSEEIIASVIKTLISNKLLDDNAYIKDYIELCNDKHYGKKRIIESLKQKGIEESRIKTNYFSEKKEKEKIKIVIPELIKKYEKYNKKQKKEHVYQALLRYGFEHHIIHECLIIDDSDDKELLYEDYIKIKDKALRKYKKEKVSSYIVGALLQKGYNYSDIKSIMEDDEDVN